MQIEYIEIKENNSIRLDKYLSNVLPDLSRTYIKKLIDNQNVLINENIVKSKYVPKLGDTISIKYEERELDIKPEDIPLDIIFENDDCLVVNKQSNLIVHPTPNKVNGTLVNGLLFYLKDNISTINGVKRPGIVHRIDKDTTGNIIIAKNDKAHKSLSEQFKNREVTKIYYALVHGKLDFEQAKIDAPIGRSQTDRTKMDVTETNSKEAVSYVEVIKFFDKYTLLKVKIITGRTHQIRVHMKYINHPIVGDKTYGFENNEFDIKRPLLHSKILEFKDISGNEVSVESDLPEDFKDIIKLIDL